VAGTGLLRHLDAKPHPLVLEDDGDGINDTYAGIGFAMDYDFVLEPFGPVRVRKMFLRRPLYQATKRSASSWKVPASWAHVSF
jgi:hypothetical protein